jgi:hypothetical protein
VPPFGQPPIIIGGPTTIGGGGAAQAAAGPVQTVVGGVQSLGEFLAFITDPANLIRAAEAIAGGVLVVVGVYFVFSTTKTGQDVIKTTGAAAGAAAKGAALV